MTISFIEGIEILAKVTSNAYRYLYLQVYA